MASIVTYTDRKTLQPVKSPIFSDDTRAAAYAKAVNGVVVPVEPKGELPALQVTTCKPADEQTVKDASRAYYDRHWNPRKGGEEFSAEQRAERRMEYVTQGRLMGGDVNDLLADLDEG